MAANPTEFNYANFLGIQSVAAAIVFAVVYAPLFGWFMWQLFRRQKAYVFIVLAFFCLIRIASFVIRACLAAIEGAGENFELYIADQVLFGVGFFSLLYSAYSVVLDRQQLTEAGRQRPQILRIAESRRSFTVPLLAAVIIGIIGASQDPESGKILRDFGTIIFFILTVLLALRTLFLTRAEDDSRFFVAKTGSRTPGSRSLGREYGSYILCMVALLLLVRMAFAIATINDTTTLHNEHFWYPLYALPEALAVILYTASGLVPPRSELPN
ncbi:hypothetical protein C0995_003332 [Termitomyces sp. Mi166|nr:hypothetical protein C0995_003332 [Termitomyces sp. Mi166\